MAKQSDIVISSLTGGMNNTDSPHMLPDNQCVQAENVEFFSSDLGERRLGMQEIPLSDWTLSEDDIIVHLSTHLPKLAEIADNELFGVSCVLELSNSIARRVAGVWSVVTPVDIPLSLTPDILRIKSASIHGKWFVCYKSAVDRMHVWDGTTLRRTGLAQSVAPSVNDSGGVGTITGERIYRVRFIIKDGDDILLRGEPSEEVTITPSGANDGVVIHRPALPGEGETHWEVEASSGDGNFYLIATLPIATLTYTDTTVLVTDFADGTLSEDAGDYELIPSVKFVVADQDRLIFAGNYEDPEKDSRIMWTPVWAAPGVGNDERVPIDTDNFEDLDWMVGGGITGLSDPVNGSFYAFKHNRIYKVQRTGDVDRAYEAFLLSATRGAIQGSVVNGADELGRGCVYFLDPQAGPARIGSGGLQFMKGLRQTWLQVNTSADMVVSHGVYYPDKQQVHWWVAVDAANSPNYKIISQVNEIRSDEGGTGGGWITATGTIAEAWCSCIVPEIITDEDSSVSLLSFRPYGGYAFPHFVQRCDIGHDDNGVAFRAKIVTKPYILAGLLNRWGAMNTALLADPLDDPAVTLDIKMIRDFGAEETMVNTDFLPDASEIFVIKRFDNAHMSNATAIQFEFSDPETITDLCD